MIFVYLTDAPTDYDNVWVTIDDFALHKAGGPWRSLPLTKSNADTNGDFIDDVIANSDGSVTVDLLALHGVETLLAGGSIDPGHYTQMRLRVLSARAKKGMGIFPVRVPSGAQTGVKIKTRIDTEPGQAYEIHLDFDAEKSIRTPKQREDLPILHPVIEAEVHTIIVDCRLMTGTLDTGFNGQGWVVHHDAAGGDDVDEAEAIALDDSGRILVGGSSDGLNTFRDMVIWRYNDDGTLDTTFNNQGWVVHRDAAGGGVYDQAMGVVVDPAGRILAAGKSDDWYTLEDMVIWRYNDNGTLDSTFDGNGWVIHHNAGGGNGWDVARAIALDGSGRILAAGHSTGPGTSADMAIWRYNEDGTLDMTFNGQGWVVHDSAAGGNWYDWAGDIALDSTGRILTAGFSSVSAAELDMAIWRYDENGTLDTTFNSQGWVTHHDAAGGGGWDAARGITLDIWGRILVAGYSEGPGTDYDMVIWRYEPNGTLDTSFNGQGWVVHDSAAGGGGRDEAWDIAVDGAGRVLTAGYSDGLGTSRDMVIWRYDDNGTLDTTFNGQGWVVHHDAAGGGSADWATAMVLDPFCRIVAAGSSYGMTTGEDMVVWRYK